MECVQETPLLKFNPNTLEEVRTEINLDHDGIEDMLKQFYEWIDKQQHFTRTDFNRHYLETSIIIAKGSLERAKKNLDKLCTLKTLLPSFFSKHDIKKDFKKRGFIIQATMPNLLENNYRLYIFKIMTADFDSALLLDVYRFCVLMSEYMKMNDYTHGFVGIMDCRDINIINLVTKINIVDLRNTMAVLMEGYGWRVKAIHLISESKSVDAFVSILKQVVSAKIGSRIKVHKTIETIYEHVPKKIMPVEYGGEEKSLKEVTENWVNVLSEEKNVAFFKEICKPGTDEKYRLTATYNDQILGMAGSFRTLVVD